jgi:hypothetical protein
MNKDELNLEAFFEWIEPEVRNALCFLPVYLLSIVVLNQTVCQLQKRLPSPQTALAV